MKKLEIVNQKEKTRQRERKRLFKRKEENRNKTYIKKRAVRNEDLRLEIKKRLKKMVVLNVYERISVKVDGHRE